ncbi:hypothetical protein KCU85_g3573, partial [Aureobasidium melanogenum]
MAALLAHQPAARQKFSRLPVDEQLAFCAERGNIEPVMDDLDKQRKAKMRDISKMTDQIQEYLKATQKAEDHANTHAAVSRTADDRAKVEKHKKMFDTTIVKVREKCFGDKDLATRLVKPMKYHPTQHTKAPMYFNRYITRPTANDDGYDTKEVEQVIVKLIDVLEQSQMTDWTKEQQIAELKSEASDAASTIAEQDQEIQKVKRARDDFQAQVTDGKKDLHKARTQYDDLESNHKEEIQDWEKKQNEWKEVEQDLTTKLGTANTDLNTANTNLKAAKKDVSRAEEAQETAERKFRQLQEASSEADKNYQRFRESAQKEEQRANELEKQLEAVRESEGSMREQNETLRSEKESLVNELPQRLQDREDELNQSWEEEIERRGEQLQEERNRFEQKAQEEATKLRESNDKWSKALTAVITTSITNEDILQDHLKLVLPEPFSSMDDFSMVVDVWYVFADTYTGLASDVSQAPRDDLRMIELLRWIIANKTPDGITNEALDQVVWLETHLLAQIRSYSRSDAWVLLAFNLLRKIVLSSQWPGCCMAAVRLARLANQYPMYDQSKWDNFVTSVIVSYKQLDK